MEPTAFERSVPEERVIDESLAGSILKPFWLDDAQGRSWPSFSGEHEYDLVVVGGGLWPVHGGVWPVHQLLVVDAGAGGNAHTR